MFIDTHCHLIYPGLIEQLDEVVVRAEDADVKRLVLVTAREEDYRQTMEVISKYQYIYGVLGVHPDHVDEPIDIDLLRELAMDPKVVGIGETGLDYYEEKNVSSDMRKLQQKMFREHISVARDLSLPIVVHTRDAAQDTQDILIDELNCGEFSGVMHCYTGSYELAKALLDRGFYFSASGILTFKNSDRVREVFSKIPLSNIVIETDAPYCTPVPYRGKINEPAYVVETAKMLAEVHGVSIEILEEQLMKNTKNLFPKMEIL